MTPKTTVIASRYPFMPLVIAACAAAITFVPTPPGGIRVIQAMILMLARDSVVVAALLHAVIAGVLSYVVFWVFHRRGATLAANVVPPVLFIAYVVAYFSVGLPMVASVNGTLRACAG